MSTAHLRGHDQSNHLVASIAAALNTSLIGVGTRCLEGGGGGFPPQHRWSAQPWADGINLWHNAVLAFNHPKDRYTGMFGLSPDSYKYCYIY